MGWGFVPLTRYQGGGPEAILEPLHEHLEDYKQLMIQYYGAGVQACYRLTNHYFSGIDEWSLVFQSDTATLRDGSFTSDTLYTNAWYYGRPIAVRKPPIEIPGRK